MNTIDQKTDRRFIPGRIARWVVDRLGEKLLMDRRERAMRLVEEVIELAQAEGIAPFEVKRVTDHIYSRPVGEPDQEMGGVMVCAHAWAIATSSNLDFLTAKEVSRIENIPAEVTRMKHAAKALAKVAIEAEKR